jgi:serine/threonine protein kinase
VILFDFFESNLCQLAGTLPFKLVFSICEQSLEYLKILKLKKIVHADFKLENLLLKPTTEQLSVCDLGFSEDLGHTIPSIDPSPLTPLHNIFQTIYGRAPEIFLGYNQFNESIDIYSLGVVLFELYTGQLLFPIHEKEKTFQILNYHLQLMIQQFGMPPLDFIKPLKRSDQYFLFDHDGGYRVKHSMSLPDCNPWQSIMRKKCAQNKDPADQIEQLIALMEKMLRYKDRITPSEGLLNPLFSQRTRFSLSLDDPSLHNHILHIYHKPDPDSYEHLLEIDLSLSPALMRCLHLPYLKDGYNFLIHEQGTDKVVLKQTIKIDGNANLLLKKKEGQWVVEKT